MPCAEPGADMRRREFITLVGGAAAGWPLAALAQQPPGPTLGFLNSGAAAESMSFVAAFRKGLAEAAFHDGQNVQIAFRWADGQYDRLPQLVADLVNLRVAAIMAGGPPAAQAAKAATTTIPIVFTSGIDPVKSSLVASLNKPGGNVTGISVFTGLLGAKQLDLLLELVPKAKSVGLLVNPSNPLSQAYIEDVKAAAMNSGHKIHVVNASSEPELESAFGMLVEGATEALIVGADPFFLSRRKLLVALAARHSVPTMYEAREFAAAGGLISYGASLAEAYRLAGAYTGRILKGEKPSDLPVMQPTIFELVLNAKTAGALGLNVPPMLIARADEVIE
jgi:putative ABC transport system substrate-binding protein